MNLEQLKIFLTVAESRSFTRAAELLYISHSTTSRSVAALEAGLGVQLLIRDNRTVRLTPAGELLYREGVKLMKKVDGIVTAVRNTGMGVQGQLTLASVNIYSHELSGRYHVFCRKYPEVMLGIYHRAAADVLESVEEGESDLGVTFSFTLTDGCQELEKRAISREKMCVVVPVGHPLAARKSVRLEELRGENFLTVPAGRSESAWRRGQARLAEIVGEMSPVPTVESLFLQVKSGNGVALSPQPVACEHGSGCAILYLSDINMDFDVVLIWRRDNPNPSLPLFVETILEDCPAGCAGGGDGDGTRFW